MDYFDILKRAWKIAWDYKILWVLGLFVGVGSGGSSGTSTYSSNSEELGGSADQFARWASDNVVAIAVVAGLLAVIGIAMWIISIAAQGGLVHGTNEVAEGRAPSLKQSWSAGFAKWGRTFMVNFVLGLPIFVIALVLGIVAAVLGVAGFASGDEAGAAAAGIGICLALPLFIVVIIAAAFLIGLLVPVALRYGVINDVTYGQAIKRAWGDLWGKKGMFMFYLVMLLPGFAYGIALMMVMVPLAIPVVLAFVAEQYIIAVALTVLLMLVAMVPGAIYSTFVYAAWTLFFRQMTGMEPKAVRGVAITPPYAPPVYAEPPVVPVAEPTVSADAPIVDVEPPAAGPPPSDV